MRPNTHVLAALSFVPLIAGATLAGCEEKPPAATPPPNASTPAPADDHDHDHGDVHHTSMPGHGGPVIALGEQTIGSFAAVATRDQGEIVPGKDAPIDVTVTPIDGATSRPVAIRFWIGTQDARGSVKARAEIENPSDPNRWHVHADVPNPLPEGSKLWVEIEDDRGQTTAASFDLKR
jgi:hypothetical protein